jgi:hypothetical protein
MIDGVAYKVKSQEGEYPREPEWVSAARLQDAEC